METKKTIYIITSAFFLAAVFLAMFVIYPLSQEISQKSNELIMQKDSRLFLEGQFNEVKSFKEKPTNSHFANAGIYIVKKELLKNIPHNTFYNATDLIQYSLDRKLKVIHNQIVGYWIDIGSFDDLKRAEDIYKHIYR